MERRISMAKNLIIGAFTGYDYQQLKPWVESVNEVCGDCDKVMIAMNASYETLNELTKRGFKIICFSKNDSISRVTHESNIPIHVERFLHIYDYLDTTTEDYDYVVTTDVKDVYFQKNPFEFLEEVSEYGSIICGSECIKYKDEPWGNQNLLETYGSYIHEKFKDNIIYNVGVLGGKSEYIKDLALNIFLSGINRPIPIVDQAVFNVLIQTLPFLDCVIKSSMSYGWACQAGTVADPNKLEQFKPFLLEKEPRFEDGVFMTETGKPFCIVHQYDRVPEWKRFIEEKYGIDDSIHIDTSR